MRIMRSFASSSLIFGFVFLMSAQSANGIFIRNLDDEENPDRKELVERTRAEASQIFLLISDIMLSFSKIEANNIDEARGDFDRIIGKCRTVAGEVSKTFDDYNVNIDENVLSAKLSKREYTVFINIMKIWGQENAPTNMDELSEIMAGRILRLARLIDSLNYSSSAALRSGYRLITIEIRRILSVGFYASKILN